MVKIGVTGHRPKRLAKMTEINKVTDWLDLQFYEHVDNPDNDFVLITGMAQGVDQIAAHEALLFGGRIWCYYPYRRKMHEIEDYLNTKADKIRYEYEKYVPQCYIDRDRRIVDDCDILFAVWDGEKKGGTWQTIEYARKIGRPIVYFGGNPEEKV